VGYAHGIVCVGDDLVVRPVRVSAACKTANTPLIGKTASTEAALEAQAQAYVRARMYGNGKAEWEGVRGFWHKTLPVYLGREKALSGWAMVALFFRLLFLVAAGFVPILIRRVAATAPPDGSTVGQFLQLIKSLSGVDYLLAGIGVSIYGIPKMIESWQRNRRADAPSPYGDLAAAIEKMPPLDQENTSTLETPLRLVLDALQIEMSNLIGDRSLKKVTQVTLLQYCDAEGRQMQVTARTALNERTHFPQPAKLFLANYVAREGRWFAEHDFTRASNPFKPQRLSVVGSPKVHYRSVLFLPIMTVVKKQLDAGIHGPVQQAEDRCLGVICVHSEKPFRFWRWGDQRKEQGMSGFGNVALQQALPYIALIGKMIEGTAPKVPLEAKHG